MVTAETQDDSSEAKGTSALCPAGKSVISGGWTLFSRNTPQTENFGRTLAVWRNFPVVGAIEGWAVLAYEVNPYPNSWAIRVFAICADLSP